MRNSYNRVHHDLRNSYSRPHIALRYVKSNPYTSHLSCPEIFIHRIANVRIFYQRIDHTSQPTRQEKYAYIDSLMSGFCPTSQSERQEFLQQTQISIKSCVRCDKYVVHHNNQLYIVYN